MDKRNVLSTGAYTIELKHSNKVRKDSNYTLMCDPENMARDIDALIERIEHLEAERDFNSKEYNAFIEDIWAIVGDGKGSWDYPGQVIRYAGYLKEECDKLKSNKAAMRAFNLSEQMSKK